MSEPHVISVLVKRRAELTGELQHTQLHVRKLLRDLEHLDATIRQFDPGYRLEGIKPKGFHPKGDWASPNEMSTASPGLSETSSQAP